MKSLLVISLFVLANTFTYANGEKDGLNLKFGKKEIKNWEGVFKYEHYIPIKIKGLQEIIIVIYKREGGGNYMMTYGNFRTF